MQSTSVYLSLWAKFWAINNIFCWKFAAVCRKIENCCPHRQCFYLNAADKIITARPNFLSTFETLGNWTDDGRPHIVSTLGADFICSFRCYLPYEVLVVHTRHCHVIHAVWKHLFTLVRYNMMAEKRTLYK